MLILPSAGDTTFTSLLACLVSDASTPPAAPVHHTTAATTAIHLNVVIRASSWKVCVACRLFDSRRRGLTMPTIRDGSAYLLGVSRGEAEKIRVPLPRQQ